MGRAFISFGPINVSEPVFLSTLQHECELSLASLVLKVTTIRRSFFESLLIPALTPRVAPVVSLSQDALAAMKEIDTAVEAFNALAFIRQINV